MKGEVEHQHRREAEAGDVRKEERHRLKRGSYRNFVLKPSHYGLYLKKLHRQSLELQQYIYFDMTGSGLYESRIRGHFYGGVGIILEAKIHGKAGLDAGQALYMDEE